MLSWREPDATAIVPRALTTRASGPGRLKRSVSPTNNPAVRGLPTNEHARGGQPAGVIRSTRVGARSSAVSENHHFGGVPGLRVIGPFLSLEAVGSPADSSR